MPIISPSPPPPKKRQSGKLIPDHLQLHSKTDNILIFIKPWKRRQRRRRRLWGRMKKVEKRRKKKKTRRGEETVANRIH